MKTIILIASLVAASPAFAFYPGSPLNTATIQAARKNQAATTNASTCYTVGSADSRAYCLAKAHNDPGRCYSIQDSAMRSMCLAEVRR